MKAFELLKKLWSILTYESTPILSAIITGGSDKTEETYFGSSIALSRFNNLMIVGIPGKNKNTGEVQCFYTNEHFKYLQDTITVNTLIEGDRFGTSVAISANGLVLAIGAPGTGTKYDERVQDNTGSVYVYVRNKNHWELESVLSMMCPYENSEFGSSLSLSLDGKKLIVGSSGQYIFGKDKAGRVYCYAHIANKDWVLVDQLCAYDYQSGYRFGSAVSLSANGDELFIGSEGRRKNKSLDQTGAVYHFIFDTYKGWHHHDIIEPYGSCTDSKFGSAVSLSANGDELFIGASNDKLKGTNTGSVYKYNKTNGKCTLALLPFSDDNYQDEGFGSAIAVNSELIAIGSPKKDISKISNSGAVYLYGNYLVTESVIRQV
jgi:hypothetical protein